MNYIVDTNAIPWRAAPAPMIRCGKVLHDGLQNPQLAPVSIGIFKFEPGQYGLSHTHQVETEIFYTVAGGGTLVIDGNEYKVKTGMLAIVPPGIEHYPVNNGEKEWQYLAIFTPAFDMSFVNDWEKLSL
ncbi:MAG: cupin domain-containing protein [Bacillota bacterium]